LVGNGFDRFIGDTYDAETTSPKDFTGSFHLLIDLYWISVGRSSRHTQFTLSPLAMDYKLIGLNAQSYNSPAIDLK
jgi:hypothetical protein